MSNQENDFDVMNAAAVKELPEWKRQYDLSVASYTPMRSHDETPVEVEDDDERTED